MPALSPASWLDLLERRLDDRWAQMVVPDAYFEGDHRLAFATVKWREAFGATFANVTHNWCPLVVESSVERLAVQGFRFGSATEADSSAWDIWQANNLDAEADMAHTEAVKLGESYWLVEPPAPGSSDPPRITAEHPSQVIVATAPGDRRVRVAALKRWWDDDGYVYATLFLPEQVVKYRSAEKAQAGTRIQWTRRPDDPGGANPLGAVPVVPLSNEPSLLRGGQSDLMGVIPVQDALNKLLSDMMIGSEYQAFPQRVLLGAEIPKDPTTGQPMAGSELRASQSRLWIFENENAKVQQFDAASLDNYINTRRALLEELSATTRIPQTYVAGKIHNVSADTLKAAETGMISKVKKKMRPFGEGHEETMRLAFRAVGDKGRADATDAETIWRDPETRSFGELVDGLVKLATIGVPHEILWEKAGFGPVEIERMKAMQATASLFGTSAMDPNASGAAALPAGVSVGGAPNTSAGDSSGN